LAKRSDNSETGNATPPTARFESQLWQRADALRDSVDAAEDNHVVLGLIFLTYISDVSGRKD